MCTSERTMDGKIQNNTKKWKGQKETTPDKTDNTTWINKFSYEYWQNREDSKDTETDSYNARKLPSKMAEENSMKISVEKAYGEIKKLI